MEGWLVIGIGNPARGDDGVGHEVVRLLATDPPPGTCLLTATDLDVAMAAEVASVATLVVVDAQRRETPEVETYTVEAGSAESGAHSVTAQGLLGLAGALYGHVPSAYVVSVAAPMMEHTTDLSPVAQRAAAVAAARVRELVAEGEASV